MTIIKNELRADLLNTTDYRYLIIDTYLLYWGRIQRKDLTRHLGIGNVTATRIFGEYSAANPEALLMNPAKKSYVYTENFIPLTSPSPESVLPLLAYGTEQKQLSTSGYGPMRPNTITAPLCQDKVSAVTRAMVSKTGIEMSYVSGSSGSTQRCIYPHAIFNGGGAWYFRGYDPQKNSYRTFRFSRIESIGEERPHLKYLENFTDKDWNEPVTLSLAPHSRHPQKEALAMDLGLQGRPVSNVEANRVTAGSILVDLRVDCSKKANLNPKEYHLQLMNLHELDDIKLLKIAPGYVTHDSSEPLVTNS